MEQQYERPSIAIIREKRAELEAMIKKGYTANSIIQWLAMQGAAVTLNTWKTYSRREGLQARRLRGQGLHKPRG